MPRATVIIPTYNWSSVLRFSIASVLRQTMRDFELLVVGDACTDDSGDVAASFADPRVRWINLPENVGDQSGPCNEGIRAAQSPIVAYLGHDDLWLPHHLDVMCAAIDAGADVAHAIASEVPVHGLPTIGGRKPAEYDGTAPMTPSCVVHRAEAARAVGGWRAARTVESLRNPDSDFWFRMQAAGMRFVFVPRLVSLKFPAVDRPKCYVDRPCREQEEALRRIEGDPNIEASELVRLVAGENARWRAARTLGVTGHARALAVECRRWLADLASPPDLRPGSDIDRRRKIKGLDAKPRPGKT